MEHRHLGRSGLKVSEIAYGNWITHGSQVEEEAATACVAAALDEGITTFDTADVYAGTRAESVMGRALQGVRTPLEETLRAFDDLVRQGKVLYLGVSEWRAEEISAALAIADQMGLDRIVSNQPQYNMLWRVIESEVLPLCMKEGIGQIVWSPIAQGALTGKYQPGQSVPAGSRATDESGSGFIRGYLTDAILSRVAELRPVAEEAGLSMAQLAIAWVLQNPGVSAAIIGATRPEQVRENVKASGVQLDAEIKRKIDGVLGPVIERDPARTVSPPARP